MKQPGDLYLNRTAKIIIFMGSLFLSIIIIFAPLSYYIFNSGHYRFLYEENGVFDRLDREDVLQMTEKVFDFFKYRGSLEGQVRFADPAISSMAFFTPEEISHMEDVRMLLQKIFISFYGSVIIFFLVVILAIEKDYRKFLKKTGMIFIFSSSFTVLLFLMLFFLSSNFTFIFERFHRLFFPQGNYSFSASSLLISMFPLGFFNDYFICLVRGSMILTAIFLITGIVFMVISGSKPKLDR